MADNRWHEAYQEPNPLEAALCQASYDRLVPMERTPGMLADTSLAGRLWGLHDFIQSL